MPRHTKRRVLNGIRRPELVPPAIADHLTLRCLPCTQRLMNGSRIESSQGRIQRSDLPSKSHELQRITGCRWPFGILLAGEPVNFDPHPSDSGASPPLQAPNGRSTSSTPLCGSPALMRLFASGGTTARIAMFGGVGVPATTYSTTSMWFSSSPTNSTQARSSLRPERPPAAAVGPARSGPAAARRDSVAQ